MRAILISAVVLALAAGPVLAQAPATPKPVPAKPMPQLKPVTMRRRDRI